MIAPSLGAPHVDTGCIVDLLVKVMQKHQFSHEQLLANTFDRKILGAYCTRLGKSEKGTVATLAGRIAIEWSKASFQKPLTLSRLQEIADNKAKGLNADGGEEEPEYVIEAILEERKVKGKMWYLVSWQSYTDQTWEPKTNIDDTVPYGTFQVTLSAYLE